MINTIIFDFGEVFINLDIEGFTEKAFSMLKVDKLPEEITAFNGLYEQGLISTDEFIQFYLENFPYLKREDIIDTWNSILKDFPKHRLDFLKEIKKSKNYKLILLSNTNDLHIEWIKENISFYEEFKDCFNQFYLSHQINLSKPNKDIFEFVINKNNLIPNECLFIDDKKENTDAAAQLKIHTWNNNPKTEDVSDLFKIKSDLF